jgi:hypothetical protein
MIRALIDWLCALVIVLGIPFICGILERFAK